MSEKQTVVVVGLGEVGRPLLELLSDHHTVIGVDIAPPAQPVGNVDVMHVCYPFEIPDFVGVTAQYIERFRPALTIIDSTVAVAAPGDQTSPSLAFADTSRRGFTLIGSRR